MRRSLFLFFFLQSSWVWGIAWSDFLGIDVLLISSLYFITLVLLRPTATTDSSLDLTSRTAIVIPLTHRRPFSTSRRIAHSIGHERDETRFNEGWTTTVTGHGYDGLGKERLFSIAALLPSLSIVSEQGVPTCIVVIHL